MLSSADESIHGLTVSIPLTTVKSRVRLPGDIISRLRLHQFLGSRSQTSSLKKKGKKDRDLDRAHAIGRDHTRVEGSTDVLSSCV